MDNMHQTVTVSIPPTVRFIFGEWAADFEAAPSLPGMIDSQAIGTFYRRMAGCVLPSAVERGELAVIYGDAMRHALATEIEGMKGIPGKQAADMRDEARQILEWLAPILAADVAPRTHWHCRFIGYMCSMKRCWAPVDATLRRRGPIRTTRSRRPTACAGSNAITTRRPTRF
jgi:hypothetical protein